MYIWCVSLSANPALIHANRIGTDSIPLSDCSLLYRKGSAGVVCNPLEGKYTAAASRRKESYELIRRYLSRVWCTYDTQRSDSEFVYNMCDPFRKTRYR